MYLCLLEPRIFGDTIEHKHECLEVNLELISVIFTFMNNLFDNLRHNMFLFSFIGVY